MTYITLTESSNAGQNLLNNGGFEVWQRGTTFNSSVNAQYTADCWKNSFAGTLTVNITQESTIKHDGLYSMKVNITAASGGGITSFFSQIENPAIYGGQKISASAWINTSISGIQIALYDGTTATGSAFHPGDGQWHQLTVTATMQTTPTAVGLFIAQSVTNQTGIYYADSVMMVLGSNPVSYVQINPANELVRCQRFFETSELPTVATLPINPGGNTFIGAGVTASISQGFIPFKVTKRIVPTVLIWDDHATANQVYYQTPTGSNGRVAASVASPTVTGFNISQGTTNTGNYMVVQWAASADL